MKPIGQYVLVKPYSSVNISEGGLFIPDSVKRPSNKVLVIDTGKGSKKKPMLLKNGQTGFRVRDWGESILIEGELHYLLTQDSIIALQCQDICHT